MLNIGYQFNNADLLQQALTHSSYIHEHGHTTGCNERLEFLGDAVLELSVSEMLFNKYPSLPEGELTKRRAALVCEPSLAELARELSLGEHLRLGHGEKISGGQNRDSLLADALEAVFGAVYMDGGFGCAKTVIQAMFEPIIENAARFIDPKSALQEIIQSKSREALAYAIVRETGPAHQKEFTAVVSHEGRELGLGKGRSKKEAEQHAAMEALKKIMV